MVTDKGLVYLYSFGSAVAVRCKAPSHYRRIKKGSICGMRVIASEESSKTSGFPVGTVVYLVEDRSGDSLEIPEEFLKSI